MKAAGKIHVVFDVGLVSLADRTDKDEPLILLLVRPPQGLPPRCGDAPGSRARGLLCLGQSVTNGVA